jgi:hypothetical protein
MLRLSGLWGMIATGLVLLWGSMAIAQSSASPNESSTTGTASEPPGESAVTRPLICDSSGEICIVTGKPQSGPAPAASAPSVAPPTQTSATPIPAASPSPGATAGLPPPSQQSLATARPSLICDVSGKICAPVVGQPAGGSISYATKRVHKESSLDHTARIRIDGVGAYDANAGLISEEPSDWVVHAYKSRHRLDVYFRGHLYRTYHAVFGRSPETGAKLWEGDRRTPEGNYLIVGKHPSARFGWFLHINYPNERDHERFEQSRAARLIPASASEGGQIGIHGTDSPYLNVAEVDWTTGCISVDNSDIRELAQLLPVGTLVVINP